MLDLNSGELSAFMASDRSASEEMISTREAGRMLGVTSKTVIRMIETGQIPGYRVNFVWKLRRSDVETYLETHRYRPDEE